MQPQYVYEVSIMGERVMFTWPNCAKKYLRDTYTVDGELHLPPESHVTVTKYKVNPKAGSRPVWARLDIEAFLDLL